MSRIAVQFVWLAVAVLFVVFAFARARVECGPSYICQRSYLIGSSRYVHSFGRTWNDEVSANSARLEKYRHFVNADALIFVRLDSHNNKNSYLVLIDSNHTQVMDRGLGTFIVDKLAMPDEGSILVTGRSFSETDKETPTKKEVRKFLLQP